MNKIESSIEISQRKYIIINIWNEINVRENWTWEIEMSYYNEIYLYQWIFNSIIDYIQRRESQLSMNLYQ